MKYLGKTTHVLIALRDLIQNNRAKFKGLRREWVGIGFMGMQPMSPAISVVPVRWERFKRYSGNKYKVLRRVQVHLLRDEKYTSGAEKLLREDVQIVQDIMRIDEGFRLKFEGVETVHNYEQGAVSYEDIPTLERFNAKQAIIEFGFLSNAYRPEIRRTRPVVRKDTPDSEVYDEVFKKLLENRNTALSQVKGFYKSSQKPKAKGLSVGLEVSTKNNNDDIQNIDRNLINFNVSVYSKLEKNDEMYLKNIEIADKIIDIFESDETIGGAVFDSNVQTINYGVDNTSSLYRTEINFECEVRRSNVNHKLLA